MGERYLGLGGDDGWNLKEQHSMGWFLHSAAVFSYLIALSFQLQA